MTSPEPLRGEKILNLRFAAEINIINLSDNREDQGVWGIPMSIALNEVYQRI